MIKKLSMMVLGVAVMGFCMAAVPDGKAEARTKPQPKPAYGDVRFDISHYCQYKQGYPRPWVLGEARHWNPNGTLFTTPFRHRSGNERASFSRQVTGSSKGDARVTVGWATCKNCQTGLKYYTVQANSTVPVSMTLSPR